MASALLWPAYGELPQRQGGEEDLRHEGLLSQALQAGATGQGSPMGSLATARGAHTATLLPGGQTVSLDPVDTDKDGQTDYIDDDSDDDGSKDGQDNCRLESNADQQDTDRNGRGDVCDVDLDGDTVANESDNCPMQGNYDQLDTDANARGNACDPDGDARMWGGSYACAVGDGSAVGLAPLLGLLLFALGARRTSNRWKR